MKGARLKDDGATTEFPFDAIDHAVDGESAEDIALTMTCEALSRILCWLGDHSTHRKRELSVQTVGLRTIAALWIIRPDVLGGVTQAALSRQLGVSDSILSRYAAEFRDTYNFQGRGQRSNATRARMRIAHRAEGVK